MFKIKLTRADNVAQSGVSAQRIALVEAAIQKAAEIWGQYIDAPNATIDIELNLLDLPGFALFGAGSTLTNGDRSSTTIDELKANADINRGVVDAGVGVDIASLNDPNFFFFDDTFEPNPGGLGANQIDVLGTLVHEMAHVLGFDARLLDRFLEIQNGQTVFTGPAATAANGGKPVPFVREGNHLESSDLLDPFVNEGERGVITPVHVGILQDLGLPVKTATAGNDDLFGYELFNDIIRGGNGNDNITGLSGNDRLFGENGNDILLGGAGNDVLDGGNGDDRLVGGIGNDRVIGGNGNDNVSSNRGNDFVDGGAGNDRIGLGSGNDRGIGGQGNDRITGGSGNDVVSGGNGNDFVAGGTGNDRVLGDAGNDRVFGNRGNDRLEGGAGNDRMAGGAGNDILNGGTGNDRLSGGTGNDTFLFNGGDGNDRITDFMNGFDEIAFDSGADQFSDLRISDTSAGARIAYDGGAVLLQNVSASVLDISDFDFV